MAKTRNLRRIDLYCPEYNTDATILIDEEHKSGRPHLVVHYEKGGLKGQQVFAAAIPAHWGDKDLVDVIFAQRHMKTSHKWPAWEVPARQYASLSLYRFWKDDPPPEERG